MFAESEVVSLIARGEEASSIALALHEAIATRIVTMVRRIGLKEKVVFAGGASLNPCLRRLLNQKLATELLTPDSPQTVGALGAALLSRDWKPEIENKKTEQTIIGRKNMSSKTFLIQSEGLGRGDDQLGIMLMANFLRLLGESQDKPAALVFWNGGVKLACEGSHVLDYLEKLEKQGVEILACTTCLEFFELVDKLKVGKPTTMVKSIQSMLNSDMVCL